MIVMCMVVMWYGCEVVVVIAVVMVGIIVTLSGGSG